ncbi:MAG: phosphatidylinositol 4-kinase [Acidobacteria bacterium]|nr:phosphatidylinositol 4-kinase [Acidobacteriota bacterium]
MVRSLAAGATLVLCLAVPPLAAAEDAPTSGVSARFWIGRWSDYEDCLRTAPIDRIEDVGQGVTKPRRAFFRPGGVAASAIVKVLPRKRMKGFWESYQAEVAAYVLDRILRLDMVPVTVERRIEGDLASVQLWIDRTRLLSDVGAEVPPRPYEWARQVRRQRVFDALIANIDRNAGNMLVDEDWNMILIDHSRAFMKNETPFLDEISAVDRPLYEAVKALDEATLDEQLKPWLFGKGSVKDLLKRRDKIVEKLEKLARERGEAAVFTP